MRKRQPVKVYVASPLGFSETGREFYYGKLIPSLEKGGKIKVVDPWVLTAQGKIDKAIRLPYGPEKRAVWAELNKEIGFNNLLGIRHSDALLAVLDGPDVDSGTAAEIGYAHGLGRLIVGYRNDFRLSGDNEGSIINLQVEFFIHRSGGRILSDYKLLREELKAKLHV